MKKYALLLVILALFVYSGRGHAFNYFYNESLGETFSSSTTLTDKMTLEFTPPYASNYTIIAYAEINSSNLGNSINVSFSIDGTLYQNIPYRIKDLNDSYPYPFLKKVELSVAKHNLSLQLATNDTSQSVAMKNARIFAFSGEVEYAENESLQADAGEGVSFNFSFTPPLTDDYLIVSNAIISTKGSVPVVALMIDDVEYANSIAYLDDTQQRDHVSFGFIQNISLTNSSHKIQINLTGGLDASSAVQIKSIHIAAIKLSQFKKSFYNQTNTEAGTIQRSIFQSNLTLDYTPNAAAHFLMGSSRSRGSATASIIYQINNGTANLTNIKVEETNAAQRDNFFFFSIFNMTNNSRNDRLEHTTPNGGTLSNFALNTSRLTALELNSATRLTVGKGIYSSTVISQNTTFFVTANVTCTDGACAHVTATLMYNATGSEPDSPAPSVTSTMPFYTIEANPKTCSNGPLETFDFCIVNWTVNVTTTNQSISYYFNVNFSSQDTTIQTNTTTSFQINTTDSVKPTVTLNLPSNNSVKNSDLILFNCTASDGHQINNVSLYGNWSNLWHLASANITIGNNVPYLFDFNITRDFVNQTDGFFTSSFGIFTSRDITTVNGSEFWIIESGNKSIMRLNATGTVLENFSYDPTLGSGTVKLGITTVNGSEFWVSDSQSDVVEKLNSTGGQISNFSIAAIGSIGSAGITTVNGSEFWIVDSSNDTVFHVNSTGSKLAEYNISSYANNGVGIDTIDGTEFWIFAHSTAADHRYIAHVNRTFGLIQLINVTQYTSGNLAINLDGGVTTHNGLDFRLMDVISDSVTHLAVTRNGSYVWNCYACDNSNNCNFASTNNTLTVQVPQDISFTIFVPANNATGLDTSSASSTDSIVFNTTNPNGKKVNATAIAGTGNTQNDTVSIFRYLNTGTQSLDIKFSFGSSPTCSGGTIAVKAANADVGYETSCSGTVGTTTCSNIATAQITVASSLGISQTKDVWLWADYTSCNAGLDTSQTLTHASSGA